MPKKLTFQEVKSYVENRGFTLLSTEYKNSTSDLTIICPKHGTSNVSLKWLRKGTGCYQCGQELKGSKLRMPVEIVRDKIRSAGYEPAFSHYENSKQKLKVMCKIHGEFFISIDHITSGSGCRKCGYITVGIKTRTNLSDIRAKVEEKGYELLSTSYDAHYQKIKLKCSKHGIFYESIANINANHWCKPCGWGRGSKKITKLESVFIEEIKHTGYALVSKYESTKTKAEFNCRSHGNFLMAPGDLLDGHGCRKCASSNSKLENELCNILESIYPDVITNDRKQIKPYELDVFVPSLNLGIEYCGLYWHCEKKKDKNYHAMKMKLCNQKGIRLITIFEDEWLERKNQVLGFLTSVLNKNPIKIGARKTEIRIVDKKEASIFLDDYHIQGKATIEIAFGLYFQNDLVGLITGNKHHRKGHHNSYVLNRLVFKKDVSVAGGSSKLLKSLVNYAKEKGYSKLISWSDNRWSEGNVYQKLGFVMIQELPSDYSYSNKQCRISKQSCQKKHLLKKGAIGTTEKEMADSIDYFRIWDCGKKRWEIKL